MPRQLRAILSVSAAPLLLGLLTTVAITWSLAAWLPQRGWIEDRGAVDGTDANGAPCVLFWSEFFGPGAKRRCWNLEHYAADRFPVFGVAIDSPIDGLKRYDGTPPARRSWSRLDNLCSNVAKAPPDGCEHATGWPWLAASYEFQVRNTPPWGVVTVGGIEMESNRLAMLAAYTRRALPFRPICPGLCGDIAVFGLIWFTLMRGVRRAHRFGRERRGLCPTCGYDRRGLTPATPCPECGQTPDP